MQETLLKTGFRLPTLDEHRSLLWKKGDVVGEKEFRKNFNAIDARHGVWSSTPNRDEELYAWQFDYNSHCACSHNGLYECSVRLVRDKPNCVITWQDGDNPLTRYQTSECGNFITDTKTGLEWCRYPENGLFTWYEAIVKFNGGITTKPY